MVGLKPPHIFLWSNFERVRIIIWKNLDAPSPVLKHYYLPFGQNPSKILDKAFLLIDVKMRMTELWKDSRTQILRRVGDFMMSVDLCSFVGNSVLCCRDGIGSDFLQFCPVAHFAGGVEVSIKERMERRQSHSHQSRGRGETNQLPIESKSLI